MEYAIKFNCYEYTYYSNECWAKQGNKVKEQANLIKKKSFDGMISTLLSAHNWNKENESNAWFFNIGASNHIIGKKEIICWLD